MQHRLMTEYEWRKHAARASKARPDWWGAQCLYPTSGRERLKRDRSFHLFMFMCSVVIALLLPVVIRAPVEAEFLDSSVEQNTQTLQVRKVNAVTYQQPTNVQYQLTTFTIDQLLRGKMMLLDETHSLPADAPPPNTVSIARYGKGMVPVHALSLKTGRETIEALTALFAQLRQKNVDGLYVWKGATTETEQRKRMISLIRSEMKGNTPDDAVISTRRQLETPGTGDLLQEYAVEMRFMDASSRQPDGRILETIPAGQVLLQLSWRHGFVRTSQNNPFRFRYVGKAHATAMTYLDLSFTEYLDWLHEKGVILISAGGQPQYLILCKQMTGSHIAFDLPVDAVWEASLDNTGYALVACTFG